jgi:hypothetical protein
VLVAVDEVVELEGVEFAGVQAREAVTALARTARSSCSPSRTRTVAAGAR